MKVSNRGAIPPFLVIEAFKAAKALERAGHPVVHLSLGQPGREIPKAALEALATSIQTASLGYTEPAGILPLRQRIVQHYKEMYGIDVPIERIFITMGSSAAFLMSILAAFDPGDQVAITLPAYPAYPNMLKALQVEPVYLRGCMANNFQPTVAELKALPKVPTGLVVASPSNPAGTIMKREELKQLCAYTEENNIRLISDEIYHGVTYTESKGDSILEFTQKGIVVNSFSKYFLMPGWRLGWAVLPEDLVPNFEALASSFFISPAAIAQYAALEVFKHLPELNAEVERYKINRDILLDALPRCGFHEIAPAEGAFYVYANVSKLTNDSVDFCERLRNEIHIAPVSGLDFDPIDGKSYIRFSFAGKESDIRSAMERLESWVNKKAA